MLLTPSFIKKIIITIRDLLRTTPDPTYQADALYKVRAFEKDIRFRKVQILKQMQVTSTKTVARTAC